MPYYDINGDEIDLLQWVTLFDDFEYRVVGKDEIGGHTISTVWMGLDHSFGYGPPLIFETMIFGPSDLDNDQRRYSTYEEAEAGHLQMVLRVIEHLELSPGDFASPPPSA